LPRAFCAVVTLHIFRLYALTQLHGELAGKLIASTQEAKRLTLAMLQVEAGRCWSPALASSRSP
jgi:hypothetical protein